jgi:uncharacterized YigZ family protein
MNLIPDGTARTEIRVSNSRFIGTAGRATSVAEARAFIASVRSAMPDASHHVYAYIIGHGASTTLGMSDDGEPSGTAGRPILAILQGSGLGDVVVVVTRYFGGTLLGTGGLVHAYGDAAKAVLAELPRTEKIERCSLLIVVAYTFYERAKRLAAAHCAVIDSEDFATDVTLAITLPVSERSGLEAALIEATAGDALVEELDSDTKA